MTVDSACSKRLPNLKFIGNTLSVSSLISLVTLTFDFLTSNVVRVCARGVGNFPTNFGVSRTFRSRLMGQHLSDRPRDLATLTFYLGGNRSSVIRVFVLHQYTRIEVRRPFRSFGRYDALPVSALVDMVTMTYDL